MQSSYQEFLRSKRIEATASGFEVDDSDLNPALFPFQRAIVKWALRKGRAAVFSDCGTGKTLIELAWGWHVHQHTGGNILILAPLAVARQTQREGDKFNIPVSVCRSQDDVRDGLNVTNYEMLRHFDPLQFTGLVTDESSILKGLDGVYRKQITEFASHISFRLAATATPAPNDLLELARQAEYLGIMREKEITALYFTQDGNSTSQWRLKGHAREPFWKWLASWSVALRSPSDLGFPDTRFELPPLHVHQHTVSGEVASGRLFAVEAQTLSERLEARRESIDARALICAELVNASAETWVLWCNLNAEGDALRRLIPDAVEVRGSDPLERKEDLLAGFSAGKHRVLISKPSICGHGLNWQFCHNTAFVGLSDSWEQWYQAVRRTWRFGQTQLVDVHVIIAETEGAVVANIKRKERQATEMMDALVKHMKDAHQGATTREEMEYDANRPLTVPDWLRSVA